MHSKTKSSFKRALLVATFVAAPAGVALSQDVTIGVKEEPANIDPHFGAFGEIYQATHNSVYQPLIVPGPSNTELEGVLATSWGPTTDTVWRFELREGVEFHDGSAFDAEDVVATIERIQELASPSPLSARIGFIERVEAVGPLTVDFVLSEPVPEMAWQLLPMMILPSEVASDPDLSTEDFSAGEAAIGTGPYRISEFDRGSGIEYTRFEGYWGDPAAFETVSLRFIPDDGARVAALISGDVAMINNPPPSDLERLGAEDGIEIVQTAANRSIWFHFDMKRDVANFITDKAGEQIPNPLLDRRVREALSIAVDRETIVERIQLGLMPAAGQIVSPGFFGYNPDIGVPPYDPEAAQALLEEAGYPDGFRITIHGIANFYYNDVRLLQAIASYWERIGVETEIETLPGTVYWSERTKGEHSFALMSWGMNALDAPTMMLSVLHPPGGDDGRGALNTGGWFGDGVAELLQTSLSAPTAQEREQAIREVMQRAVDDVAIMPLQHYSYLFAIRSEDVGYDAWSNVRELFPARLQLAE